MTDWFLTWKAIGLGALFVIGSGVLGFVYRESALGNVAGVVGLAVSIVGFVVTVGTVLDARRQITDASDRAEQAIAQAREETQRAVQGIASQLLAADCAALQNGVADLRQAAQNAQWHRAFYRGHECRLLAYHLAHDWRLTAEEKSQLREGGDDLLLISRFIEKNRLAGQGGLLKDQHLDSLDGFLAQLAAIQARLHYEPLRPAETPPTAD